MEKDELRQHLTTREIWVRGLYMLLFAVIYSIAEIVVVAVVVFQFIARLVTGEVNQRLLIFGQQLSGYLYDMLRFFTFNTEEKPYPFAPWNRASDEESSAPAATVEPKPAPTSTKKSAPKKKTATKKRAVTTRRPTPKREETAKMPETKVNDRGGETPSGEKPD